MARIKILHIIDSLNIGGTEKQCVEIVKGTRGGKYDVRLVTLNKEGALCRELHESHIPFIELKISGGFYHPKSIIQIFKLALFMRKEKIHIVQTYGFYSTLPGVIAAKIARVPVVIAAKRDMNELISRPKIVAEKILWIFCDRIVVNAKKIQDYLTTKEDVPREKISVIYNGVDLRVIGSNIKSINYKKKSNIVGMIARFRWPKDYKTFLDAAVIVLKTKMDVRFLLIGSGPLEADTKEYAEKLGIQDNVIFCGRKTGEELYNILKSFTISVLSTASEGIPNVLLESMAFGIPIISNPVGGIPELVEDGVSGCFFENERSDMLSEKIIYLLDNIKVAREMGMTGRRRIEQYFSYTVMMNRYTKLYDDLLQKKEAGYTALKKA